jgi:hypothetical protein
MFRLTLAAVGYGDSEGIPLVDGLIEGDIDVEGISVGEVVFVADSVDGEDVAPNPDGRLKSFMIASVEVKNVPFCWKMKEPSRKRSAV